MQKRNFILLIVFLIIVALVVMAYLYNKRGPIDPDEGGGGAINFLADLLPFGKKNNNNTDQPIDISDYRDPSILEVEPLTITKVSSMPIAGYGSFMKERFVELPAVVPGSPEADPEKNPTAPPTEFVAALRYADKATGNIFQTYADRISERKFGDLTIPKVVEALFGRTSDTVAMRYLRPDQKTIATFLGRLPVDTLGGDATDRRVLGSFLPENVTDMTFSPSGSEIFYLYNLENSAIGMTASSLGENKNQVLDLPYTEWITMWPNQSLITLTTKASGRAAGYMYGFDTSNRKFTKILGGIFGLTTLTNPDGNLVLYNNNNLDLYVFDVLTRERISLGLSTLPEKCVWAKDSSSLYCAVPKYTAQALYPDAWYQGEISFEDELWKIETINYTRKVLIDLSENVEGVEHDGIKLTLSENEDYLFWVNKKDSYLWEIRLK